MATGAGEGLLGEVGLAPRSLSGGSNRTVEGGAERTVPAGIGAIIGDAEGVYGFHGIGQGSLAEVAGAVSGARGVSGTGDAEIGALTGFGLGHGLGIVNTEGFYGPGHAVLQTTQTVRATDDGSPRITSTGALRTADGGETHAHIIGAGVGIVSPPVEEEEEQAGGAPGRGRNHPPIFVLPQDIHKLFARTPPVVGAGSGSLGLVQARGSGAHGVAGHGAGQMALVSGDADGWHTDTVSLDNEILLLMAA